MSASGPERDAIPESNSTAFDLLSRARQMEGEAWRQVVDRYSWLVFQWCRNAGLKSQDAGDVVQSVMAQVAVYLPTFKKDGAKGSFRRWLRTITRTKIVDFHRVERNQPHGEGGSAAQRRMLAVPDDAHSSQSESTDDEKRRNQMWQFLDQLEDEFEDSTWQAFWLTMIENQTAAEAATALEMTPNAVRIAKWRVLTRMREAADHHLTVPGISGMKE